MKKLIIAVLCLFVLTSCNNEPLQNDESNVNTENTNQNESENKPDLDVDSEKENDSDSKEENEDKKDGITILTPKGAPAFSVIDQLIDGENVSLVSGPDSLQSAFLSGSHDIIIAGTETGSKFILNQDVDYSLAGIITTGNLYIISTEDVNSFKDITELSTFGKGAGVDKVMKIALENEITDQLDIEYFSSTQESAAMLLAEKYKAAMIAEPAVTNVLDNGDYKILYDIQEMFAEETELDFYPQASIFIRNTDDEKLKAEIDETVKEIEEFVNELNKSESKVSESLIELENNTEYNAESLGLVSNEIAIDSFDRMNVNFYNPSLKIDELIAYLDLFSVRYDNTLISK